MQELWEQSEDLQTAGSPQTRVWASTRKCRVLRGMLCLFSPGDLSLNTSVDWHQHAIGPDLAIHKPSLQMLPEETEMN